MTIIPCRVLPHETADGPALMALDEALLDAVAADPSAAAFRTYEWDPPTLSLGYFQATADVAADPRWRGVPVVRRPTGGGAIWHHHEVTYALVVPRGHPLARRSGDLYRAVHSAIADLLRARGVAAGRRGETPQAVAADRPFLCFADRDPEDVVAGGSKLVGSAQRRRSGAVLQHGSVLLARSPATPELPGASDLAPVAAERSAWAALLRDEIPAALGLRPHADEVTRAERERAAALERAVYRRPSWTARR
jgi:lipoate-protein ligase A